MKRNIDVGFACYQLVKEEYILYKNQILFRLCLHTNERRNKQ